MRQAEINKQLKDKYSRAAISGLNESARRARLRELEDLINLELRARSTLSEFQEVLYAIISELEIVGHFLGRWDYDYDCEVEIWGGKSYMDPAIADELMLRSEFPKGVRFAWNDYDALQETAPNTALQATPATPLS